MLVEPRAEVDVESVSVESVGVFVLVGVAVFREVVRIALGVASGFPTPRPASEDKSKCRMRRPDLRPILIATVSL